MINPIYPMGVGIVFFTDEALKSLTESGWLEEHSPGSQGTNKSRQKEIPLVFRKYHNYGAMMNLGSNNTMAVTAISLLMTAGLSVIYLEELKNKKGLLLKAGLTLMLGGACSNVYDRLRRGYVIDYISFKHRNGKISNIVYNIGDFAIFAGSTLTAVSQLKR